MFIRILLLVLTHLPESPWTPGTPTLLQPLHIPEEGEKIFFVAIKEEKRMNPVCTYRQAEDPFFDFVATPRTNQNVLSMMSHVFFLFF